MIKISVSFNKKVPGEQQYSSLAFESSIDRELAEGLTGEQIKHEMHRSYALLEKTVEAEIVSYTGKQQPMAVAPASQPAQAAPAPAVMQAQPQRPTVNLLTQKQINLIRNLANQQNMSQQQLCDEAMRHYRKPTYHELSKKEASSFIEMLSARKQAV